MNHRPLLVAIACLLVSACCCPPRASRCCPPAQWAGTDQTFEDLNQQGAGTPSPEVVPVAPDPEDAIPPADAETELRAHLSKKRVKGLKWEDTTLDVALTYLRTITGVSFQVSAEAREALGKSQTITLQLDDVAIDTVLDLVTSSLGLRWEARDGVVWVVPGEQTGN